MRWCLPFTASFIRNQIVHHQQYEPAVVYLQKSEGGFLRELSEKYPTFCPFTNGFDRLIYEKARLLSPRAKSSLARFIEDFQPGLLHLHYGVDTLVYAGILSTLDIPVCVSFYGYDCTSFPNRFYGYGRKLLKKHVFDNPGIDLYLAMTEDMKKDLIRLGCPEDKIIVHYYGTETKPFQMERSYQEGETVNLMIISSFQERKGHAFLIDAFAQLQKSTAKNVHLHIVGDGYLRRDIEQKIAATGLNNITLHGPVQYGSEEHLAYFRMADIFVHPSVTPPEDGEKEGIPGAIIEAMAAGLPVVSTYHAGIPYIIESGKTGILVREYDTDGLKGALQSLVEHSAYRETLGRAGQEYATRHLDITEKELELEHIYELMTKAPQRANTALPAGSRTSD